jgi:hypothetical protein
MDIHNIPVILRVLNSNKKLKEENVFDNINILLESMNEKFPNHKKPNMNIIMIHVHNDLVLERLGGSVHNYMIDKNKNEYYLDFKNKY